MGGPGGLDVDFDEAWPALELTGRRGDVDVHGLTTAGGEAVGGGDLRGSARSGRLGRYAGAGQVARASEGRGVSRVLLVSSLEEHHAAIEGQRCGHEDGCQAKPEERERLAVGAVSS